MDLNAIALKIDIFVMILTRITGIIIIAPVFSSRNIPAQVKIGMAAVISLILFNVLKTPDYQFPDNLVPFILILVNEFIIGLAIGFTAQIIFAAIQLAGELIDMQMGFGIVNVIDPNSGAQVPLLGNFKYLLALMIYLSTNSHHILIKALFQSYEIVPIMGFHFHGSLVQFIIQLIYGMFVIALQISMPILGALFLVEVALGFMSRTVPQMNVFVVGMPAKIVTGFIVLGLMLPFYVALLEVLFNTNSQDLLNLLKLMR